MMEQRQFGKTDMRVSVLGFGGAEIGFERAPVEDVKKLLSSALDAGLNVIDTAECYLASEELIGEAVSHRRKEYHLFTKCGHPQTPGVGDWRPESLLDTITRSLTRLKTDRVDLVQLHSCSEDELRKGDVIAALKTARERGYTRYIGYSGDGRAARYAVVCGAFDTLQTSVSIADQEAIDMTIPLARDAQMGVITKRPIANAAWKYDEQPAVEYHRPYWERLKKLNYDFLQGDMEAAVSTALRFTLSVPGVHTAIVGTKNPNRWQENAELLKAGPLPESTVNAIRARWRATAAPDWTGQT
jgi:aryl-alcohol dehydrogenase-like predicted oxidoreductase